MKRMRRSEKCPKLNGWTTFDHKTREKNMYKWTYEKQQEQRQQQHIKIDSENRDERLKAYAERRERERVMSQMIWIVFFSFHFFFGQRIVTNRFCELF